MKTEKRVLVVAVISIIAALPITNALQKRGKEINFQRSENSTLKVQIKSEQKKAEEVEIKKLELQKQNEELQRQLQAKQEAQAKALAIEQANIRQARLTPNCQAYKSLVAQYDWDFHTAMAIMQAESGCRAITPDNSRLNYDGVADHGLFQLHGINVTDPAENIRIAYQLKYKTQGWRAWSAYKNNSYKRFL